MCIDIFTSKKYSLRFQQPHYISKKGIISEGDRNKHANSAEQPIPLVAENRHKYETIFRCIHAEDYLWGAHELPILHGLWPQ